MLAFLPASLKALLATLIFLLNTFVASLLIYPFALIKFLIPLPSLQNLCRQAMIQIGQAWISVNDFNMWFTHKIEWDIQGLHGLSSDRSYLVTANHQSWIDIVILQHVFNRRIPFLRFFLKKELIYVPLLGLVWWALDFPFMNRHSKKVLARHPEKRSDDFKAIQKACEVFKGKNVSVLNFLEGTRFTNLKHQEQRSPFKNLLNPKSGGLAYVLNSMGTQFDSLLDVTIHYPGGAVSLWESLNGKLPAVTVRVKKVEIPRELLSGDYLHDIAYKNKLQSWLQDLWKEKDQTLQSLK